MEYKQKFLFIFFIIYLLFPSLSRASIINDMLSFYQSLGNQTIKVALNSLDGISKIGQSIKNESIHQIASVSSFWDSFVDVISDPFVPLFLPKATTVVTDPPTYSPPPQFTQPNKTVETQTIVEKTTNNNFSGEPLPLFSVLSRSDVSSMINAALGPNPIHVTDGLARSVSNNITTINNRIDTIPIFDGNLTGDLDVSGSGTFDTNTLVIDATNNRVGIGTTTPYTSLSVEGNSVLGNSALAGYFTSTSSTASIFPYASTTALSVSGVASTTDLVVSNITSGSLLFAGTAGALSQNNSSLFWDNTNARLGIGTSTPSASLHIDKPSITTSATTFGNIFVSSNDTFAIDKGGSISLGGHVGGGLNQRAFATIEGRKSTASDGGTSGYFIIKTSNSGTLSERLRIDNTGNVGIGTTTPWASFAINPSAGVASNQFVVGSSTATNFVIDNSGRVGIGTTTPAAILGVNGSAYVAGNITATGALSVTGAGTFGSNLIYSGGATFVGHYNGAKGLNYNTPLGVPTFGVASDAAGSYNVTLNGAGALGLTTTGYVSLGDVSISRQASGILTTSNLNTTGNLGVGTTSPWRLLSVGGTMAIAGVPNSTGNEYLCHSTNGDVSTSTTACGVSSQRYKHNIESLDSSEGLDLIRNLRPVSFEYNNTNRKSLGFVAEEVAPLEGRLAVYENDGTTIRGVDYISIIPILTQGLKEVDRDVQSLADMDETVTDFSDNKTFLGKVFDRFIAWFGDVTNGIVDFFANRVHTQTLCVGDEENGETCINKTQLDNLISNTNQANANSSINSSGNGGNNSGSTDSDTNVTSTENGVGIESSETSTTTPPVESVGAGNDNTSETETTEESQEVSTLPQSDSPPAPPDSSEDVSTPEPLSEVE